MEEDGNIRGWEEGGGGIGKDVYDYKRKTWKRWSFIERQPGFLMGHSY